MMRRILLAAAIALAPSWAWAQNTIGGPVITQPGSGSLGANGSLPYPAACGLVTTLGTSATQVCPVSSNGHRFYLFIQLGVSGGTLACSDDGTTTPVIGGAHTITSAAATGAYPSIAWGPAFVPAQAIWCIASGSGPLTAEQGY